MGFLDKVKNLLAKNADKVDTAIDKAGDIVDKKTQGKYTSTSTRCRTPPRRPSTRRNPQTP